MSDKAIRFTVELTRDQHTACKVFAAQHRISMQQLAKDALIARVGSTSPADAPTGDAAPQDPYGMV